MMNTHVHTMAAGSSSGTTLAVNLILTPAGRRVSSTYTKTHAVTTLKLLFCIVSLDSKQVGTPHFEFHTFFCLL